MSTHRTLHIHRRNFAALHCLAWLTLSAVACDSDPNNANADANEAEAGETPAPLVRDSPEVIDGVRPVGFDVERQLYIYDRDDDGFPDITEALEGTDMFDPDNNPAINFKQPADPQAGGFPAAVCRAGFVQAGPRLCINKVIQNATRYRFAVDNCRNQRSNVCSYEDLTYLYLNSDLDAVYDPKDRWIGNITDDNLVLCGNRSITFNGDPDLANFEGTCSNNDVRGYWCCHDDE
ncbi:hypothetical protein DB30_00996 [Enhygromyxa salina]|uniref:Lipoprotein n=1 Tax=Enhygromyxa salina TaxID=215803 RepID=A0A0C1ZP89_9BACT|nr:hypothetical protein [Enhygromyxa salina]KIG12833.1 hypothetical protein DB30_00996 [Enhygromyxa salina]